MASPDVVVIGAGIVGTLTALRLAQAGLQVTVIDRVAPGAEASSAAAGILAPQMEAQAPGPMLELCLRSRALYPRLASELSEATGLDIGYRPSGVLQLAFDEPSFEAQARAVTWQRGMGLRAELLDARQLRALEPHASDRAVGGSWFADDHQLEPRKLLQALSQCAQTAGVTFRLGHVTEVRVDQHQALGVVSDGEALKAGAVVLAAGSWSGQVRNSGLGPDTVRPAKGQLVELHLASQSLAHVLFSEKGYVVPRPDGRVVCGSTLEHVGFDKRVTASGIREILDHAFELCPLLEGATFQDAWAGLRPYTEDHLPIIGPGPVARLFLGTGHFRNGILLAPVTAQLLRECVLGEQPSVDLTAFRLDRTFTVAAASMRPA